MVIRLSQIFRGEELDARNAACSYSSFLSAWWVRTISTFKKRNYTGQEEWSQWSIDEKNNRIALHMYVMGYFLKPVIAGVWYNTLATSDFRKCFDEREGWGTEVKVSRYTIAVAFPLLPLTNVATPPTSSSVKGSHFPEGYRIFVMRARMTQIHRKKSLRGVGRWNLANRI